MQRKTVIMWNDSGSRICAISTWTNSRTIMIERSNKRLDIIPQIHRIGAWQTLRVHVQHEDFLSFSKRKYLRRFVREWKRKQLDNGFTQRFIQRGLPK